MGEESTVDFERMMDQPEEYIVVGASPTSSSSNNRKTKSKSSKSGSSSKSGRIKKVKRSRSRGSSSNLGSLGNDRSVSVGKLFRIIQTTLMLIADVFISIPKGGEKAKAARGNLVKWIRSGFQRTQRDPMYTLKLILLLWCCGVLILTIMSLLGFDVSPTMALGMNLMSSDGSTGQQETSRFSFFFFRSGGDEEEIVANGMDNQLIGGGESDDVSIPAPTEGAQRKKISKKLEIKFACDEVDCIEKCSRKTTPKCKQSNSCMKVRVTLCKKKCRKQRCESRCKEEPQIGYVEREMKLEKCKEDCSKDQKCIDKCEREFQTCKSKCAERRKKFQCDREPDIPFPNSKDNNDKNEPMTSAADEEDATEDFTEMTGAAEDEEI